MWVDFCDAGHASVIELAEFLEHLPYVVRQTIEESMAELQQRAAKGAIHEDEERAFEPVSSFPLIYELKWKFTVKGDRVHIRQYHGEPTEVPELLIALHRHLKDTSAPAAVQRNEQNAEMSQAALRLRGGEPSLWGTRS